jgi:hypothetical protein
MKLHGTTLAKGGLTIKFIILIETSRAHTYYFKSKLSKNKKYISYKLVRSNMSCLYQSLVGSVVPPPPAHSRRISQSA